MSRAIGVADLKPAACTSGTLVSLVTGSGVFAGTTQNDLMLGGTAIDTIDGRQLNDCILGGAGDDVIDGFNGTDVYIGGWHRHVRPVRDRDPVGIRSRWRPSPRSP